MINLHTIPGKELPELVWHHAHEDDPHHFTTRWNTPMFSGWDSKPTGGLYASVMQDFRGQPPVSSWARWAGTNMPDRPELRGYVTTLHPDPDAVFVVIDSEADAVAAAQAFPGTEGIGTLHKILGPDLDAFMEKVPDPSPAMGGLLGYGDRRSLLIDCTRLAQYQYAGLYLTDRGVFECQEPKPGVPWLSGWDVPQVWFRAPLLSMGETSRWQRV